MRTWADVAVLAKTRNLNGGFVAKRAAGLPFLLEEGMEVALVPPRIDAPRNVTVDGVDFLSDTSAVVHFAEVEDASMAKQLVGSHCLVRRADVGEEGFDLLPESWEGWHVLDVRWGQIGSVREITDNGVQQLLVVDRSPACAVPSASESDEALIPVVDEFIADVDVASSCITVSVPKSLLEL